ncbi:MAG: PQQ-binding-like beta-propeller repeat protein [Spirochaetaceae bacterium]|jgi:outer membrane protein assembly factor BamB|nr:PQQ-binding-like beta-propeller repeat protein [Spirochaetaceae bacterium]
MNVKKKKTTERAANRGILCLAACLFLAGCSYDADWVQFRGKEGRGVSSSRISPPLGIRWKIRLQLDEADIESFNPPVVIGDTIYFGSGDGNFYALDVESGYMRWAFRSGGEINAVPYADRDRVYFGSKDGKVYALNRHDGEELWSFRTRSQVNSQVERYKDNVVFVSDADAIYFLNPETGEERFSIDNPGWYNFTFLMADDVMYFATGPRTSQLGPYDINKREFLWFLPSNSIAAHWYSFAAVKGDLLYFGAANTFDLSFFAFNRHTGQLVWQQYREAAFGPEIDDAAVRRLYNRSIECLDFLSPTVWRNLVIYTGLDTAARAFDAKTGAPRWEKTFPAPVSSAPTVAGDRVYFGLLGNETAPPALVCLSARNGRELWRMETEGSLLSAPVITGKRIIFGTDQSVFYVLEEIF